MMKNKENGQHFLLSAQARSMSVAKIARLSEDEVYETFKSIRWSTNKGNPICHHCWSAECWSFKTVESLSANIAKSNFQ